MENLRKVVLVMVVLALSLSVSACGMLGDGSIDISDGLQSCSEAIEKGQECAEALGVLKKAGVLVD